MITQRAIIVATIGFCLYFIAFVNALPSYFYVLTWLSVSILVSSAGLALLSVEGLKCRWHVAQKTSAEELEDDSVPENEEPSGPVIEIEIENRGTLNKTGTAIDVRLLHIGRGETTTRRFLIEALPANTALTTGLTLSGLPRGRYHVLHLTVMGTDVLGFFRARRRVVFRPHRPGEAELQQPNFLAKINFTLHRPPKTEGPLHEVEILVGPATVEAGSRSGEGSSVAAGSETSAPDLVGRSDEMRGTRPYVAGDDLRTVHWKSTARLGRLVVREFDRLARPECVVIWDGSTDWGNEHALYALFDSTSPVEFGLSLAASMARAMTENRRPCALLRLDSLPIWVSSQNRMNNIGSAYLGALEALTTADAGRRTPLTAALGAWTKELSESSEIFLISAARGDELKDAVSALRRLGLRVEVGHFDSAEWPDTRNSQYVANARGWRGRRAAKALLKLARRAARTAVVSARPEIAGARVVAISPVSGKHGAVAVALRRGVLQLLDRRSSSRGQRGSGAATRRSAAAVNR